MPTEGGKATDGVGPGADAGEALALALSLTKLVDCLKVRCVLLRHVADPWFTHIASGAKRVEGRVAAGAWTRLRPGHRVT